MYRVRYKVTELPIRSFLVLAPLRCYVDSFWEFQIISDYSDFLRQMILHC